MSRKTMHFVTPKTSLLFALLPTALSLRPPPETPFSRRLGAGASLEDLHDLAMHRAPFGPCPNEPVVAKCVSWIYLLSELFAKSRKVVKSREKCTKSREKVRKVERVHPPKGPGACRVLLASVSYLQVIGAACFDFQSSLKRSCSRLSHFDMAGDVWKIATYTNICRSKSNVWINSGRLLLKGTACDWCRQKVSKNRQREQSKSQKVSKSRNRLAACFRFLYLF